MGNQKSIQNTKSYLNWKKKNLVNLNNVQLMQYQNNLQGQLYHVVLENKYDHKIQQQIYKMRNNTLRPLIKVYDWSFQYCKNHYQFDVITQRIPYRLQQAPQLTYSQSLYVLQKSLQGYDFLYNKLGSFDINKRMIGFTKKGQVKVWMNENYGSNYPSLKMNEIQSSCLVLSQYTKDYIPISADQAVMVQNICNLVQSNCQEGIFHEPFKSRINRQSIGFKQAQSLVLDQSCDPRLIKTKQIDFLTNLVHLKSKNINRSHILNDNNFTINNRNKIPTTSSHLFYQNHTQQSKFIK